MKSVNTHQVTQHWAIMMNWPFAFCSLLFCYYICEPWWYSERALLGEKKSEEIKRLSHGFWLNRVWNTCDLTETWASPGCRKGNHVRSVFLAFLPVTPTFQSVHLVCPSSDVVLRCFRDNCFLAVFTISECFVAGAAREPLIIVDVPFLQRHRHLHDFPPVVDSKVFRTFCKTCL